MNKTFSYKGQTFNIKTSDEYHNACEIYTEDNDQRIDYVYLVLSSLTQDQLEKRAIKLAKERYNESLLSA